MTAGKELLETQVKPLVEQFLAERGLELSQEKTRITHIEDGFDFLGQNVRKHDGKLIISGGASPDGKTGEARLWDAATLRPIGPPLRHEAPVRAAFYCLDGKRFVTSGRDGITVFDRRR